MGMAVGVSVGVGASVLPLSLQATSVSNVSNKSAIAINIPFVNICIIEPPFVLAPFYRHLVSRVG
jgi:hypothetical protein